SLPFCAATARSRPPPRTSFAARSCAPARIPPTVRRLSRVRAARTRARSRTPGAGASTGALRGARPPRKARRVPGRPPSLPTSEALRAAAAPRAGARHSPAWSSGIARTTHRRLERRRSTRPRGPRPNRLPHPRLSRRPLLRPRDVKGPSERSTERLRGLPSAGPDPPLERSLYNPGVARLRGGNQLLRAFFVIYALEAGAFLTFAPWGRY